MRAREFIIENTHSPGWQDPTIINYPYNLGRIEIGDRLDENLIIVESMYNYYNSNITHNNEPLYGLRYKNNMLYEYDQILKIKNKPLVVNDLSKNKIVMLFLNKVTYYMNINKGTDMEYSFNLNYRITPSDLLNITPELKEILENSIDSHGKYYPDLKTSNAGKIINVGPENFNDRKD